ncbi:hypothetical protein [Streptomyces sp. NPDC006739]|uniref:hypothetical protein n=1 Tax=Streptomyces sp. NPDC006739 TaxID=3364763 RepID=UPI00367E1131
MTKRRSRGDGGLHRDEKRQRWIATANLGFDPSGERIVKRGSGKTKTEAGNRLKEVLRDHHGIKPDEWTPRELRHSFVSLLSDRSVPPEEISRLVGHSGTAVTEGVYRKQIRPVIQTGAVVMDGIFGAQERRP